MNTHARAVLAWLLAAVMMAVASAAHADTYPRQPGVDVVHYVFRLALGDATSEIAGEASVTLKFAAAGVTQVFLDLASPAGGRGMTVSSVSIGHAPVLYAHAKNRLRLDLAPPPDVGQEITFTVRYAGIPAGGLRIGDNIHGQRTVFSENWPNQARQWLPTIDHPYDKASGELIVTAPAHYQVVANGLLVEEIDLPDGLRRTHWKQSAPIASWLYAIGVARFATRHYAVVRGIPQQIWVFPQDREKGDQLFDLTGRRAFEFFSDSIGPYPYEKLAHVQAAGLGGGIEHASVIFYGEKGVAGGRAPVVHEVAHQWWGNSVTERDWDDVWLSEGFATYFTHLYAEQFAGRDAFVRGLRSDIATIVQAQKTLPDQPVIHRNISDMSGVLNRLVYQKGSWVLHMLRGTIGTEHFWAGIREYYRRYRDRNASTSDLREVMERQSDTDLSWFFDQWLHRSGMPKLSGGWRYDAAARQIAIDLSQVQTGLPYRLPLQVGIEGATGAMRVERIELKEKDGRFTLAAETEPASVTLDPDSWILMDAPDFARK